MFAIQVSANLSGRIVLFSRFPKGTGRDSAISQVCFSPAMVREEVVNFKLPKALYDMGQAVVDTGGAESMFIVD